MLTLPAAHCSFLMALAAEWVPHHGRKFIGEAFLTVGTRPLKE
jgi:hypothetical protein